MTINNQLRTAIFSAALMILPWAGAHAHQSGAGMTPGSGPSSGMMSNMPQAGNMGPGVGRPNMMGQQGSFDPRMMGPGMMGLGIIGPGMMGPGMMGADMFSMMHGAMPGSGMMANRARPFTEQELRRIVDGRLALRGLSRLKVGAIEAIDDTAYTVDIVTLDDSLAVRLTVDKQSGQITNIE